MKNCLQKQKIKWFIIIMLQMIILMMKKKKMNKMKIYKIIQIKININKIYHHFQNKISYIYNNKFNSIVNKLLKKRKNIRYKLKIILIKSKIKNNFKIIKKNLASNNETRTRKK